MYPDLRQYPHIGYDTETTGKRYPIHRAFACSISAPDGNAWYFDFRREPRAVEWLNDQFSAMRRGASAPRIICHNAAFDAGMSALAGIHIPLELLDDTVIRACLINEHIGSLFPWMKGRKPGNYSLDFLCKKYLRRGKIKIDIANIADLPYEQAAEYAIEDAILARLLWEWQEQEIETQSLHNICSLERRAMPRLIAAQMQGIRVDLDAAERARKGMTPIINRKQRQLSDLAGWDFNVNSAPQVKKLFNPEHRNDHWWVGNIRIGTTDKGGPSFGAEYLRDLAEADPRAALIQEIRSALKTRDTFLGTHILEWAVDGRVYPTINQTAGETGGTKTGRLSYVDPAMQQIPSRDKETASIVKPCFLPDEGQVWADLDMNQFEVRVFAALAGMYNDHLVKVFRANPNIDFHQFVADMTGLPRNASYPGQPYAKQLNLSMIFVQGPGATAAKMGMETTDAEFTDEYGITIKYQRPGEDALRVIDRYHAEVRGVRELAKNARRIAEDRGYIRTKFGRRIRFPKRYKSYKASGLLIQSTSADINKENWINVSDALGDRGRIVLNTHDSYSLSCDADSYESAIADVKAVVEREFLGIPLLLDLNGVGWNWWSALKNEGIGGASSDKRSKRNRPNKRLRDQGSRGSEALC